MPDGRSQDDPKVRRRTSGKLVGPYIVGATPDGKPVYMYSFTEVVIFDWPGRGDDWQRKALPIERSGNRLFPKGSIRADDIQLQAWPCSMSGDGYEDAGWAVDGWQAAVNSHRDGDAIDLVIEVAVRGVGSRFNRVGYTWTGYFSKI